MVEGISLAGCMESPLVVHIGQRPGPATGLPTRTEQADLLFVLYSGHGEFPRAILAPGNMEQGFSLTRHAFYLADKYQVPVFILTDQFFLESRYNFPDLEISKVYDQPFIVRTAADYCRYVLSESGISPRGIPGFGKGRIRADSDEHDEQGFITEDFATRTAMVQKRLKKLDGLHDEVLPPVLVGPSDYENLVVCWGSSFHPVKEALEMLGREDTAFLHFSQIYPLSPATSGYLCQARKKIIVESNATSQLGRLIKSETGIDFDQQILKFDGLPLMPEDIYDALKDLR
jgi:2-oxoglutarate/2-oxoacid ferredoxin oxidoreductase subunit alpha